MRHAQHSALWIRFGAVPMYGADVCLDGFRHSKRLSSPLSSHLSQQHSKAHPNRWGRDRAPGRGSGSRPSIGSGAFTWTPAGAAGGGSFPAVGVASLVSRVASSGSPPKRSATSFSTCARGLPTHGLHWLTPLARKTVHSQSDGDQCRSAPSKRHLRLVASSVDRAMCSGG